MNARALVRCAFVLALSLAVPLLNAADAKLVKKSGSVTITAKDGAEISVAEGGMIPDGATVTTGADGKAFIQPLDGAVATIDPDSSMQIGDPTTAEPKEKATLNLKRGSLLSTLDPAKKPNYSVRTPRGVAAAKGTSWLTLIEQTSALSSTAHSTPLPTVSTPITLESQRPTTSIVGFSGRVVFKPVMTARISLPLLVVTPGNCLTSQAAASEGGTPSGPGLTQSSIAAAITTNPQIQTALSNVVTSTATIVSSNIGNMSSASTTTIVSQVVSTVITANPTQAATITAQVVTAVTSSTASTSTSTTATSNAVAAVTAAATQAAPTQATQIATAAVTAAPSQTAVVVAAVTQVAPQSQTQVVQQVAQTTGQSTTAVQQQATQAAASVSNTVTQTTTANQSIVTQTTTTTTATTTAPTTTTTTTEQSTAPTTPTAPTAPTPPTTPVIDPGIRPTSPSS